MAKVFLIVNYESHDKSIGVTKKIDGLINAFRHKGIEVFYTSYDQDGVVIYDNSNFAVFKKKYSSKKHSKTFRRFDLLSAANAYINKYGKDFDLVFTRWIGFDLSFIKLLKNVKKHGSYVVIDMHSYFPGIHFSNLKGKYLTVSTRMFAKTTAKYLDTILTEGDLPILFGKKTIHAHIGVDINLLKEHCYQGNKDELNIISVANERTYHGYDRLIKSIKDNKEKNGPNVKLHLVGELYDSTKQLIDYLGLNNDVLCYGKLSGTDLDAVYDKSNIAVGPLCQFRIGGKKGTGLKTKEYFGRGIPYFFSGEESDIPPNYPFVHQIDDSNNIIDFYDIFEFYNSYRDNENVAKIMRGFALENYSWDKILDTFLTDFWSLKKYESTICLLK